MQTYLHVEIWNTDKNEELPVAARTEILSGKFRMSSEAARIKDTMRKGQHAHLIEIDPTTHNWGEVKTVIRK